MKHLTKQIAFLLFAAVSAYAQMPGTMNYQGRLVDGTNLLSGAHTIEFRIYNTNAAGSICFAETDLVSVDDGFYATELGDNPTAQGSLGGGEPLYDSLSDLFAAEGTLHLELEVDGTTLSPREKIHSAAYAMVAGEAQSVAGGSITSAHIADNTITSADITNGTITRYDVAPYMRSTLDGAGGSVQNAVALDSDGNVGIGTSDPAAGVQISAGVDIIEPVLRSTLLDSGSTFTNIYNTYCSVVSGDYLYIASFGNDAITVVDVSNPDSPSLVTTLKDNQGGFDYLTGLYWLAVEGNYLYAGSFDEDAVSIIDISTPSSPTLVTALVDGIAGYNYLNAPGMLTVHNNLLLIPSTDDDALTIVDVSTPSTPSLEAVVVDETGSFTNLNGAWAVACEGDAAWVAAYYDHAVTRIDLSDPSSPQFTADVVDDQNGFDALDNVDNVAVSGGYVFVGSGTVLTVIDWRNPASPALATAVTNGTGGFNNIFYPHVLCIDGDRLYIAARYGVTVADITNPASPCPIAELRDGVNGFDDLYDSKKVFPVGNRIYISSSSESAVTIADVSTNSTDGSAGLYVKNRVGINTPLPREALDVRGNIIASQDITAELNLIAEEDIYIDSFAGGEHGRNIRISNTGRLYANSSQSSTLSVPPCAFRPYKDDNDSSVTAYHTTYARMSSGTKAMYAPVQLPDGATISYVYFYYYDSDAADSLYMALREQAFDSTGTTEIAADSSSGSPGYDYEYQYADHDIDNTSHTYHLIVYPNSSWSTSLQFMGARIRYTIDD